MDIEFWKAGAWGKRQVWFLYTPEDVYNALLVAVFRNKKYEVWEENDHTMTLRLKNTDGLMGSENLLIGVNPIAVPCTQLTIVCSLFGNSLSNVEESNILQQQRICNELLIMLRNELHKGYTPLPSPFAGNDIPDQIRKYAALREEGILTEEEFAAKKKQLLSI